MEMYDEHYQRNPLDSIDSSLNSIDSTLRSIDSEMSNISGNSSSLEDIFLELKKSTSLLNNLNYSVGGLKDDSVAALKNNPLIATFKEINSDLKYEMDCIERKLSRIDDHLERISSSEPPAPIYQVRYEKGVSTSFFLILNSIFLGLILLFLINQAP